MAGSINKVILVGNLGAAPEIRNLPSGQKVANLSVATTETWTDRATGEKRDRTEWHRVRVFSQNAVNFAESFLQKGSKVFIEGQVQTRKWQDQTGQDRYSTEVVVNTFGGNLTGLSSTQSGLRDGVDQGQSQGSDRNLPLNDDIPF